MIYSSLCMLSMFMLSMIFKYMLVVLMVMEMVIINLSVLIFLIMSMMNLEFFMIYYLVFSVCESVMGLTLMVLIVRFFGNEMYYSFNMSKF